MSSLKDFLFKDYPPGVTAMFCTTAFAVYLLINAVYYEFSSAPDHSMPSDYNRLLHNLSAYSLCEERFDSPDLTNYSTVSLLTKIHGSTALVYERSVHNVLIDNSASERYYITTDLTWENLSCEKGNCKVEKCVTISAPPGLFPTYKLPKEKQCFPVVSADIYDVYTLSLCNKTEESEMKFEFKRRNEYAKSLTPHMKREMQSRLVEIALSLLAFNVFIIGFSLLYRYRKIQSGDVY